jgi:hypothetical protein
MHMNDSLLDPVASTVVGGATAALFMWRGAGIVLFGEREGDRWVLARAWLRGDSLEYVRRWSFVQPRSFSGQVRRLIMEATADCALARDEGMRARAWAEAAA